jgi:hypothetical protein
VTSPGFNPLESENLRTRCVMLVTPGETPPQPLVDLLRDQSQSPEGVVRAEHPLLAVARLAVLERDRRIREEHLGDELPRIEREKSVLVVVNRESWGDLSPLFTTICELMPAVGIWVCTERIAIEIYAGDGHPASPDPLDPIVNELSASVEDAHDPDSRTAAEPGLDEALTEAELRDLLGHFDGADFDDEPTRDHDPDAGGFAPR